MACSGVFALACLAILLRELWEEAQSKKGPL